MKKIMVVFGTRPEAIKMCPLVLELNQRKRFEVIVCVTGQHRKMLDQVLDAFGVSPDYDLTIMREGQSLFDITSLVLDGIKRILELVHPDVVLVHGDTSTTFATALACFYMHVPVGHVEAGLRTYRTDSPYPEEFNRQAVGILSRYHFAPTIDSRDNLIREGKQPDSIIVTGNTAIDALRTTVRNDYSHHHLDWVEGSKLVLLTAHRRENIGQPMVNMFRAILRVVEDFPDIKVIYPIHMNPKVKDIAEKILKGHERIRLIEPLGVIDFHNFLAKAHFILTDSGGIQEEAPSLGVPVLVMRDTTERPEGVAAGTLELVGTDETRIYQSCSELLSDTQKYVRMSQSTNPYGDGYASRKIADILESAELNYVD